jgi:hypothetical protein
MFSHAHILCCFADTDHSGAIDYDELLYGLRVRHKIPLTMFPHRVYSVYILTNPQGQLPPKLLVLVHQIFDLLDRQCVDAIDPTTLISRFDPSRHPEVQGRMKTAEQVQKEFLDTFDVGGVQPGLITREEFVRYYTNISAAVNDDDYFEQILRAVWHIPAGDARAPLPPRGDLPTRPSRLPRASGNSLAPLGATMGRVGMRRRPLRRRRSGRSPQVLWAGAD